MKKQRLDSANNTIIGHLNINSFRSKFVFVKEIMILVDVFLFSESKYDMPSRQQKFAKKGSGRYLMFGPNHILVTFRWDDGCFPGHEKLKFKIHQNLNFENWSRSLGLVSPSNKTVGCSKYNLRFA